MSGYHAKFDDWKLTRYLNTEEILRDAPGRPGTVRFSYDWDSGRFTEDNNAQP